jgi:hypothetical protein
MRGHRPPRNRKYFCARATLMPATISSATRDECTLQERNAAPSSRVEGNYRDVGRYPASQNCYTRRIRLAASVHGLRNEAQRIADLFHENRAISLFSSGCKSFCRRGRSPVTVAHMLMRTFDARNFSKCSDRRGRARLACRLPFIPSDEIANRRNPNGVFTSSTCRGGILRP